MATVMMNAANVAYRKALKKTRDRSYLELNHPLWMQYFAEKLPDNVTSNGEDEKEETGNDGEVVLNSRYLRMEQELKDSESSYEKLAWFVFSNFTSQNWFEGFVMLNIILIGIATGADLENDGGDPAIDEFTQVVSTATTVVFALECAMKIVSEGLKPQRYFTDKSNGGFNTFDFVIVVGGFVIRMGGSSSGGALGAIRMLRLLRLLTFIKGVQQLRVIVAGLIVGVKSVVYIVMLLFLVVYLFAIMGCLLFGANDPARFGTVPMAMLSLFQVSTLASWTSIAYTSWFGCSTYLGAPYDTDNPWYVRTPNLGHFLGFQCRGGDSEIASPITTFLFFSIYIVLTSWVIMSLFIGVISMGMFDAFEQMKENEKTKKYLKRIAANKTNNDDKDEEPAGHNKSFIKTMTTEAHVESMKEMIDNALDDLHEAHPLTKFGSRTRLTLKCLEWRDSDWFNQLVTLTILVVGVMIGIETDRVLRCERHDKGCSTLVLSVVVTVTSQVIFTLEAGVKIVAERPHPYHYFTDEENGSWNCLDFFVVCVGYLEMIPGSSFLFDVFPVVVLRMLRLLRVFRLAKALPRLRSIVEALISGFSAVGWICVLIVVINYIMGCMCMLMFKDNDPFHFGSIGRSMFTVLRIETLDTWDQVVLLSMFGCRDYPAAYPFTDSEIGQCQASNSSALGWFGALVFFFIVILGAYILPTVLIGIVAISFDTASRRTQLLKAMNEEMEKILASASLTLPDYFTTGRIGLIRNVFDAMDADSELSLDINELAPFYHYTFIKLFDVQLNTPQVECLFHLMDMDGDTELQFTEFVMFVAVLKQIEKKAKSDKQFALEAFPGTRFDRASMQRRASWGVAMTRMDEAAPDQAWDSIFNFLNVVSATDAELTEEIRQLFASIDRDGGGTISQTELAGGLAKRGALISEQQTLSFFRTLDVAGDSVISETEFVTCVVAQWHDRKIRKEEEHVAMLKAKERRQLLELEGQQASGGSGGEGGSGSNKHIGGSGGGGGSGSSSGGGGGSNPRTRTEEEVKDEEREVEAAIGAAAPAFDASGKSNDSSGGGGGTGVVDTSSSSLSGVGSLVGKDRLLVKPPDALPSFNTLESGLCEGVESLLSQEEVDQALGSLARFAAHRFRELQHQREGGEHNAGDRSNKWGTAEDAGRALGQALQAHFLAALTAPQTTTESAHPVFVESGGGGGRLGVGTGGVSGGGVSGDGGSTALFGALFGETMSILNHQKTHTHAPFHSLYGNAQPLHAPRPTPLPPGRAPREAVLSYRGRLKELSEGNTARRSSQAKMAKLLGRQSSDGGSGGVVDGKGSGDHLAENTVHESKHCSTVHGINGGNTNHGNYGDEGNNGSKSNDSGSSSSSINEDDDVKGAQKTRASSSAFQTFDAQPHRVASPPLLVPASSLPAIRAAAAATRASLQTAASHNQAQYQHQQHQQPEGRQRELSDSPRLAGQQKQRQHQQRSPPPATPATPPSPFSVPPSRGRGKGGDQQTWTTAVSRKGSGHQHQHQHQQPSQQPPMPTAATGRHAPVQRLSQSSAAATTTTTPFYGHGHRDSLLIRDSESLLLEAASKGRVGGSADGGRRQRGVTTQQVSEEDWRHEDEQQRQQQQRSQLLLNRVSASVPRNSGHNGNSFGGGNDGRPGGGGRSGGGEQQAQAQRVDMTRSLPQQRPLRGQSQGREVKQPKEKHGAGGSAQAPWGEARFQGGAAL